MPLSILDFEGLTKLDAGMLAEAFNDEIVAAVKDMQDRPHITQPRTITLTVALEPTAFDRTGVLEQVDISYGLDQKKPKRKSARTACGVKSNGGLYFNQLSPNNPHQQTFNLDPPDES